jgi:hypothetical protein
MLWQQSTRCKHNYCCYFYPFVMKCLTNKFYLSVVLTCLVLFVDNSKSVSFLLSCTFIGCVFICMLCQQRSLLLLLLSVYNNNDIGATVIIINLLQTQFYGYSYYCSSILFYILRTAYMYYDFYAQRTI